MTSRDEEAARRAELEALAAMRDEDIDTDDIAEITDGQWATAVRGRNWYLARKLDRDVVDWFVARGEGYASEVNRVLRRYMDEQQASEPRRQSA